MKASQIRRFEYRNFIRHAWLLLLILWGFQSHAKGPDSTERSGGALSFIRYSILGSERASKTLIQAVLVKRCQTWAGFPETHCQKLFASFWKALDLRFFGGESPEGRRIPGLTIVFADEVFELLENPHFEGLLEQLTQRMGSDPHLDLWELHAMAYPDVSKRLKFMAAIYQDTSPALALLNYLHVVDPRSVTPEKRQQLALLMQLLQRTIEESRRSRSPLNLFPDELMKAGVDYNSTDSKNLYHFYVPAYAATKLQSAGYSAVDSALMPLLLTLSYEISSENWKASVGDARYHSFSKSSVDDLYLTYCGLHYALLGTEKRRVSRPLFRQFFSARPEFGLRSLIRVFNDP